MSEANSTAIPIPHKPGGLRGKKKVHVAGTVYGSWTLLREGEPTPRSVTRWWCRCSCGHEKLVQIALLIQGASKRCRKCAHEFAKKRPITPPHPLRACYDAMIDRCKNPKSSSYKHYGGRGIEVCDRWLESFATFAEDMGERPSSFHSLDRIDVNGNYTPENCRWATTKEQARNKRYHRLVTCGGETKCLAEWAEISGRSAATISARLWKGCTPSNAIFGALDTRGRKRKANYWRHSSFDELEGNAGDPRPSQD